ncbi:MAG: purine-nucleoside phosphorylase [Melioribacteraceae bacterium]|nr:purine-nucleoside phosphorylase [Melioribacteraceae bacterium]
MVDLNFKYKNLIEKLRAEINVSPDLSIVLGSGLGDFANGVDLKVSIPTSELPDYPKSTVSGHEGFIHLAELHSKKILLFQGRIHFYEGYKLSECILPAFVSHVLNSPKLLLTNAAGGINKTFKPGDLMLAKSFNSFKIWKELTEIFGVPTLEQKNLSLNIPSASFNRQIKAAAEKENIELKDGVYWINKGPMYETPAEIRMYEKLGNDAVGMSTVHEAIFAGVHGIDIASISCITNMAAGILNQKLSHTEVIETADLVKEKFESLVKRIIKEI